MAWHWVDYAIMLLVGLSVITGLMRGFIKEIIALAIWIIALWIGFKYSPELSALIKPYIPDHTLRGILSFIMVLLGVLLAGGLLNILLSFILNRSGLRGMDRVLGMGFGFIRGTFIVALLIGLINLTSLVKETDVKSSVLYPRFKPFSTWMFGFMPKFIDQVHVLDPQADKSKDKTEEKAKDEVDDLDNLDDVKQAMDLDKVHDA